MALSEDSKNAIKQLFEETLEILDMMEFEDDEEIDVNEEALRYADWCKVKAQLKYGTMDNNFEFQKPTEPGFKILFGGIYWAYLGVNVGHEINKHRPVVVVRSELNSNLCTVIPLSTQRLNDSLWYHIDLEKEDSTAIVEQIQVISKNRIENALRRKGKIVTATNNDMKSILNEIRRYYSTPPKWLQSKLTK